MRQKKWTWGIALALLSLILAAPSWAAPQAAREKDVLVGRVSHLEGELLYYVPESSDWVAAVADAPFGLDDAYYSGEDGRAEFILPNQTRLRIGPMTQIQLIALNEDLTQVDVASGMVRFFNDSSSGVTKVTTPFGYVVAEQNSFFDLYVGDQSVEVVPMEGVVDFVGNEGASKYDIEAGSSIIASASLVTDGEGTVDSDWEAWNERRENIRERSFQVKGESHKYLPEGLREEAPPLDEHGKWERVAYEGEERELWRPTGVGSDWQPFTAGRWTVYHGDNTWIPEEEPFGYVTHHYGNWVYAGDPGAWYWAPPVVVTRLRPALGIHFSWYPGRVGWVHSGPRIGWFPLAPFEPYYAHRLWGPRTVVVRDVNRVNININNFRFVNHAVIVPQPDLFTVRNYRNIRIRNIDRATIVRDFRPVPVLDQRVIRDWRRINQRHFFTTQAVQRVPHNVVLQRIRQNRALAARTANLRAAAVERDLRRIRQGTLVRNAQVQAPRVTNRIVNRNQAAVARQQLRLEQRDLKRQAVQLQRTQERQLRSRELRQQRREQQQAQPQLRQQERAQRLQQQREQQQLGRQQQRARQVEQGRERAQRLQQQRQEKAQRTRELRENRQQAQRQRQQELQRQRVEKQQQQRAKQLEQRRGREQALQQQRAQRQQQLQQQRLQRQERQQAQGRQQAESRRQQVQQQRAQQLQQQRSQRQQQLQQQRLQQQQRQQAQRQQQMESRRQQVQQQRAQQLQQQRGQRQQQVQQQRLQQQQRQQAQRRQQVESRRQQVEQQRAQRRQQQQG